SPCRPCLVYRSSHDMDLLAELTASPVMLYFVVHLQLLQEQNFHLDITSDHMAGSAGKTSITPDYVHAGGRVHYGSPSVDHFSPDLRFDHPGLLDLLTLFKGSSFRILASFKQSSQEHTL
nr:hypothetical protein [Tanacetum cinerariifolium]